MKFTTEQLIILSHSFPSFPRRESGYRCSVFAGTKAWHIRIYGAQLRTRSSVLYLNKLQFKSLNPGESAQTFFHTVRSPRIMDRSIAQALTGLIPSFTGPLPPELVELAVSLLAQSRNKASSLKAEEEIARSYACANLACERLVIASDEPGCGS